MCNTHYIVSIWPKGAYLQKSKPCFSLKTNKNKLNCLCKIALSTGENAQKERKNFYCSGENGKEKRVGKT